VSLFERHSLSKQQKAKALYSVAQRKTRVLSFLTRIACVAI
jgi:hypothetical protein